MKPESQYYEVPFFAPEPDRRLDLLEDLEEEAKDLGAVHALRIRKFSAVVLGTALTTIMVGIAGFFIPPYDITPQWLALFWLTLHAIPHYWRHMKDFGFILRLKPKPK